MFGISTGKENLKGIGNSTETEGEIRTHFSAKHFTEAASGTPDIDQAAVLIRIQEKFGRAIEPCDLVRSRSNNICHRFRRTQISDFEKPQFGIDQQILRFDVSVTDSLLKKGK